MEIKHEITTCDIINAPKHIPINVWVRFQLMDNGFKFVDDDKPSCIEDKKPVPLGAFNSSFDVERKSYVYSQQLTKEG